MNEGAMRFSFTRSLVVACSLLLALPPGWCCFAFHALPAADRVTAANVPPCCKHKLHANSSTSQQVPRPLQHGECPCDDRVSTPADDHHGYTPDLSVSVLQAVSATVPAVLGTTHHVDGRDVSDPIAAPSLRILHCHWTC